MARIGEFRERVRFTRKVKARRLDGGYDTTTSTVAEVFAAVKPVQATESEQAGRLRSATTYLVHIYARDDVTPEDNLEWVTKGDMPLNIREIRQAPGRNLITEIVATSESVG